MPTSINPASLNGDELLLSILSYNEKMDYVEVFIESNMPCAGQRSIIPVILLPVVLGGDCAEPERLIDRQFIVKMK